MKSAIHTLFEGAVLAVVVVFLFLRDVRTTIIAAISLPLSIFPAFWLMDLLGFSLNLVSLLAITLSTGVLVDDAIVEVENIVRHIRMGKSAYQAAIEAADEIGLAVIAISLTIVAIFAPASFMSGIAGQFFKQFGITVSVQVLFSLLAARLITPMLAAYFLRSHQHSEPPPGRLLRSYSSLVIKRHRGNLARPPRASHPPAHRFVGAPGHFDRKPRRNRSGGNNRRLRSGACEVRRRRTPGADPGAGSRKPRGRTRRRSNRSGCRCRWGAAACHWPPLPTSVSTRGRLASIAITGKDRPRSPPTSSAMRRSAMRCRKSMICRWRGVCLQAFASASSGDAESLKELAGGFQTAMIGGLLMVYAVLVLLFGSFLQPITILFSLPLSIGGAILALLLTGQQTDDAGLDRRLDAHGHRDQERDYACRLRNRIDTSRHGARLRYY